MRMSIFTVQEIYLTGSEYISRTVKIFILIRTFSTWVRFVISTELAVGASGKLGKESKIEFLQRCGTDAPAGSVAW